MPLPKRAHVDDTLEMAMVKTCENAISDPARRKKISKSALATVTFITSDFPYRCDYISRSCKDCDRSSSELHVRSLDQAVQGKIRQLCIIEGRGE